MNVFVVASDFRVTGTSIDQVGKAFVYRMANHLNVNKLDLLYLRNEQGDNLIELLPVFDY